MWTRAVEAVIEVIYDVTNVVTNQDKLVSTRQHVTSVVTNQDKLVITREQKFLYHYRLETIDPVISSQYTAHHSL